MKFTAAFILTTAALISASPIDTEVDPAAPAGLNNVRVMFNHDYDCKWRHKGKGETHQNPKDFKDPDAHNKDDMPKCGGKDYRDHSYRFDQEDEQGKCFSSKDLKFPQDQENFHSFSYCLPKRLQGEGCKFYLHKDVHCQSVPLHVIDTRDQSETALKMGRCMNVDDGLDQNDDLNKGGARSIRVECPAKNDDDDECSPGVIEEADGWYGFKF